MSRLFPLDSQKRQFFFFDEKQNQIIGIQDFERQRQRSTNNPFPYFFSFGRVSMNAEKALKIPLISEGKTKVLVF